MTVAPYPLVLVHWLDSRQPVKGWYHLSELPDEGAVECRTVGWLLRSDDMTVLCPTLADMDSAAQGLGLLQIPTLAVVRTITLKEPSRGRR